MDFERLSEQKQAQIKLFRGELVDSKFKVSENDVYINPNGVEQKFKTKIEVLDKEKGLLESLLMNCYGKWISKCFPNMKY